MRRHGATTALMLLLIGCQWQPTADESMVLTPTQVAFDRTEVVGSRGKYVANRDGKEVTIAFDVPSARIAPERAHFGTRLGETDGGAVVMLDQYASRPTAGRCTEGTETFVRIFSLQAGRQTAVVPVDSCLDGVRSTGAGAEWIDSNRFRVVAARPRTYRVTEDGRAVADGAR